MPQLPWETGQGWMPWMVGQTFIGPDGAAYQSYTDPASPTGVTVKRTDASGTSFQSVNAPQDPNAAATAFINGPYGHTVTAAEQAAAAQNQFNNTIATGQLGVQQQNSKANQQNAKTNQFQAQTGRLTATADQQYHQSLIEQAKQDLAFKYYQQAQSNQIAQGQLGVQQAGAFNNALSLGASLHGPRDWDSYLQTASAAGQNPLLQQAQGAWSSLTGVRPNTGAVSGGLPKPFDLNALVSDFSGGGGASGGANGFGSSANLPRDANLDAVAMTPGQASPGWWQGLSGDEQQRALGYWDKRGFSPTSVLNSLAYTAPTQGLGYAGA